MTYDTYIKVLLEGHPFNEAILEVVVNYWNKGVPLRLAESYLNTYRSCTMAHACDYRSRTTAKLDMRATIFKLVVRVLSEHRDWSALGLKEYCLSNYGPMGLTENDYNKITDWFYEH